MLWLPLYSQGRGPERCIFSSLYLLEESPKARHLRVCLRFGPVITASHENPDSSSTPNFVSIRSTPKIIPSVHQQHSWQLMRPPTLSSYRLTPVPESVEHETVVEINQGGGLDERQRSKWTENCRVKDNGGNQPTCAASDGGGSKLNMVKKATVVKINQRLRHK